MKLLLTSDGLTTKALQDTFFKLVNKQPSEINLLIVTPTTEKDENWSYVKETLSRLSSMNITQVTVFSLDRKVTDNDLEGINVIYVLGGNTFEYLKGIKESGLFEKILPFVEKGGVYAGISAGAIVAGPNISTATGYDEDIGLTDLTGLGLVEFLVWPHYSLGEKVAFEQFVSKSGIEVVPIKDGEGIAINGEDWVIV